MLGRQNNTEYKTAFALLSNLLRAEPAFKYLASIPARGAIILRRRLDFGKQEDNWRARKVKMRPVGLQFCYLDQGARKTGLREVVGIFERSNTAHNWGY